MARSMRWRLLGVITLISLASVAVFGTASGLLFGRMVRAEARVRLEQQIQALAATLSNAVLLDVTQSGSSTLNAERLAQLVPKGAVVTVTNRDGEHIVSGTLDTTNIQRVSAPGPAGSVLTLTADNRPVDRRIHSGWWRIAGIGALTVIAAIALGFVLARRLSRPLQQLAVSAKRVANASGSVAAAPRSGVTEIDEIADALDQSAAETAEMLRRERAFSANASHQLRSPLTAMAMHLELITTSADHAAAREAEAALDDLYALDSRIDGMLRFARTGRMAPSGGFDATAAVERQVQAAQPSFAAAGRTVQVLDALGPSAVHGSSAALDEVLAILLDNALRHGAGTVTARVIGADDHVDIEIADGGRFTAETTGESHGTGLVLARSLLRADGGTVELTRTEPTTFRIRLRHPPPT